MSLDFESDWQILRSHQTRYSDLVGDDKYLFDLVQVPGTVVSLRGTSATRKASLKLLEEALSDRYPESILALTQPSEVYLKDGSVTPVLYQAVKNSSSPLLLNTFQTALNGPEDFEYGALRNSFLVKTSNLMRISAKDKHAELVRDAEQWICSADRFLEFFAWTHLLKTTKRVYIAFDNLDQIIDTLSGKQRLQFMMSLHGLLEDVQYKELGISVVLGWSGSFDTLDAFQAMYKPLMTELLHSEFKHVIKAKKSK